MVSWWSFRSLIGHFECASLYGIIAVVALVALHLTALFALLHPKVSREYRAFYMDRVSSDWHAKHYESTPEQGIDFSTVGWPDFVEYSFGISKVEDLWPLDRYAARAPGWVRIQPLIQRAGLCRDKCETVGKYPVTSR